MRSFFDKRRRGNTRGDSSLESNPDASSRGESPRFLTDEEIKPTSTRASSATSGLNRRSTTPLQNSRHNETINNTYIPPPTGIMVSHEISVSRHYPGVSIDHQTLTNSIETSLNDVEEEIHGFGRTMDRLAPAKLCTERLSEIMSHVESLTIASLDQRQQRKRSFCLASLHEYLGSYQNAEVHYRAALPQMFLHSLEAHGDTELRDLFQSNSAAPTPLDEDFSEVMLRYLTFLVQTGQKPKLAEDVLDILPWLGSTGAVCLLHYEAQKFMFLSVQLSNAQHNHSKATRLLWAMERLRGNLSGAIDPSLIELEKSLALAGDAHRNSYKAACRAFALAFIRHTNSNGAWNDQTLRVLSQFGNFLGEWGHRRKAGHVLRKCCIGYLFRFGWFHPSFKEFAVSLNAMTKTVVIRVSCAASTPWILRHKFRSRLNIRALILQSKS